MHHFFSITDKTLRTLLAPHCCASTNLALACSGVYAGILGLFKAVIGVSLAGRVPKSTLYRSKPAWGPGAFTTRCFPDLSTLLLSICRASPRLTMACPGNGFTHRQLSSVSVSLSIISAFGIGIWRPPSQVNRIATETASLCGGKPGRLRLFPGTNFGYLKTRKKSLERAVVRCKDVNDPVGSCSSRSRTPIMMLATVLPSLMAALHVSSFLASQGGSLKPPASLLKSSYWGSCCAFSGAHAGRLEYGSVFHVHWMPQRSQAPHFRRWAYIDTWLLLLRFVENLTLRVLTRCRKFQYALDLCTAAFLPSKSCLSFPFLCGMPH